MQNNFINADLVFRHNPRNPDPDEIQPVNESEQLTQFELANYTILYPLPYEQMDIKDKKEYRNYLKKKQKSNRKDVSNCFSNSTCFALSSCFAQGFFFTLPAVTKIPVCLEITIPVSIIAGCLVFRGFSKCPEKVNKFPARSLNYFGYMVKDLFTEIGSFKNDDSIYIDSEENKKLREEFEKIKTTKVLYIPQEDIYCIAKPTALFGGKEIKIRDEERVYPFSTDALWQPPARLYPFSPDALWQPPASLGNSPRGLNFENLATRTIPSQLKM